MIESSKGSIRLLRDVSAFLVPSGDKIKLVEKIIQIEDLQEIFFDNITNYICKFAKKI